MSEFNHIWGTYDFEKSHVQKYVYQNNVFLWIGQSHGCLLK